MLVGYARVSTDDQNLSVQLDKLSEAKCTKIFEEQVSGLMASRPRLRACLEFVREGDTLVVTRLDRLARSTLHLFEIAKELERKRASLMVIDQAIDTSDATGRLLFGMLSVIAQFETELRSERQREGIRAAKARGVICGAVRRLTDQQVVEMRARRKQGVLIKTLMADYRLSRPSVYRYLAEPTDGLSDAEHQVGVQTG